MATKTHFVKKTADDRRSQRKVFRVTEEEWAQIKDEASKHQMDEAEFIRRRVLGRRVDVDFETEIVLALSNVTSAIRKLHAVASQHNKALPEKQLLLLIQEARYAIQKISR